jgi:hypothetical protein
VLFRAVGAEHRHGRQRADPQMIDPPLTLCQALRDIVAEQLGP